MCVTPMGHYLSLSPPGKNNRRTDRYTYDNRSPVSEFLYLCSPHLSGRVSIEPDGEEAVLDSLHGLHLLCIVTLLHCPAVASGLAEHPVQGNRGVGRACGCYGRRDEVQQRRHVPLSAGLGSPGPPTG